VALDLWEGGAKVTMVQRSPTCVVRSETLTELGFGDYSEEALAQGITTERADVLAAATPYAQLAGEQRAIYARIRERDAAFYDRLSAAGFLLDWGEDESGLFMKALRTASGYYIDVGCSDLIAEGGIHLVAGRGVARLDPDAVVLDDGTRLSADLVVACTGYQSMNEAVAGIVSREAADAVGPCWGLGSGVRGDPGPWRGELRNMWRPTTVPNLWFHGGNLALSRFYSRVLALQLKARWENLPLTVRDPFLPQSGL
jgi:putative flavoprotein involved in K+ transport